MKSQQQPQKQQHQHQLAPQGRMYQIVMDSAHTNSTQSNPFSFKLKLPQTLKHIVKN